MRIRAATVLALSGLPSLAAAQARYLVEDLGRLPGTHSSLSTGIAENGTVVGWGQGPQTTVRGFVVLPGQAMQELPMPPGFGWSLPTDISPDGRYIVGYAQIDFSTAPRPWRWRDGQYTMLPVPAGFSGARPSAVNSLGIVVGSLADASFANVDDFVWDEATGYTDPTPGQAASAEDINDAGEVVGGGMAGFPPFPAYKWTAPGGLQILGVVPGSFSDYARANGVSSSGKVTGGSFNAIVGRDRAVAFVGDPGGPLVQVGSGQVYISQGLDINAAGIAVGSMGTESTPDQTAWVYTPARGLEPLDPVVADTEHVEIRTAVDINDAGQIAGNGYVNPTFPVEPSALRLVPIGSSCYANCDASSAPPVLNVQDFSCFLQRYAAGDAYANCDQSTAPPALNVMDFTCFLQAFAAGCR